MRIKNSKGELLFSGAGAITGMVLERKEFGEESVSNVCLSDHSFSFNIDNFGLPEIEIKGCQIRPSRLKYVDMSCAVIDNTSMSSLNLATVKLESSYIGNVSARYCGFNGNLRECLIENSTFKNCSFKMANLFMAEIIACEFDKKTSFEFADLRGCTIVGRFDECDFSNADLRGADLSRAWLGNCNLSECKIDNETKFNRDPVEMMCDVTNTRFMNKAVRAS